MTTHSFAKDIDETTENHQRITKRFVQILNEQWGIDKEKVSGESYFLRDFGADSLDVIELVMALEEDFDIEIYDAEWEKITTVNSVIELIIDKEDRRYYRLY
ncbi:acyl carrier protein [Syntrophotalea acetylenivorans]|uniref:Acyl carrier protein n=1 Tax=Syntrophotalea acetylenivorans TaxID=1842532 RepID=A0A1L3GT37_9BACT|nr:acyl carrier protein [Syntrophotalea acetylenivorans]APG29092.1 acyl carrier protein [Syntrophotalea acetylenivorans]